MDINWQLSDNMKLSFLTASTRQDSRSVSDWDNSQYDLVLDENLGRTAVRSEEIQLTGDFAQRLEWTFGGYVLLGSDDQGPRLALAGQRVPEGLDGPEQRVQQPGL